MNIRNSEKGMTLVVVLLIITIFMVVGLAVVGASANNMKQATKVESTINTTDIAEMGVQYYEAALKSFLNKQLTDQKQKEIMNNVFTGSNDKSLLITNFNNRLFTELNNAYKSDLLLYTTSADRFLKEKTIDSDRYFKIQIDPNGITTTTCPSNLTNTQCFNVNFSSYGYTQNNLAKKLSATYTFSYTINMDNIEIKSGGPVSNPTFQNIVDQIPNKNLRKCVAGEFSGNNFIANCTFDFLPLTHPNGINGSFLVFNKGLTITHLPHAISSSTLIIYGSTTIGKFNPNGAIDTDIVVIGTQGVKTQLNDKIMKSSDLNIYINGDADLTGFELKNPISESNICITGEVTPISSLSTKIVNGASGVYSLKYYPSLYNQKCKQTTTPIGNNIVNYKGQILTKNLANKSVVSY